MDAHSYKGAKEAFVAGGTGSSIVHVNALSTPAVISIALHVILRTRLPPLSRTPLFVFSFATLVLPLLLALTVFAHAPTRYSLALFTITLAVNVIFPKRESGTPLPSSGSPALLPKAGRESPRREENRREELPALTVYRAHMLLMTALCILAVDFKIFPRALAKCETWGASLMDIGVGSFVFSQGIAAAHPVVRHPAYLSAPLLPKLRRAVRKALPVIALGLVRVVLVKGAEYPEHVTEYGVHWNFFLTLGILPLLQTLFHPLLARDVLSIPALGLFLTAAHQLALYTGFQPFVLSASRDDSILHMNKEGIVSLPGYLALHVLGLTCGTVILPPTPTAFRRMMMTRDGRKKKDDDERDSSDDDDQHRDRGHDDGTSENGGSGKGAKEDAARGTYRENDRTATALFAWACIYWTLLGLCRIAGIGTNISRRMANAPYVLWTAAYNMTFLLAYVTLDLALFPSPLSTSVYDPVSHLKVRRAPAPHRGAIPGSNAPMLLRAINENGLVFFLVANVATGIVNLSMRTMYADDATAVGVLGLYAVGLSAFAWVARDWRLL